MRQALRVPRAIGAAAAFLAAAMVGSCGSDGDGGTEPTTGRVEVAVTVDDAAVSGVAVRLYATGGSSALSTQQTGGTGVAVFSGLDAGSYEVEVEAPTDAELAPGETGRKAVGVTAGGTASVDFELVSSGGGGGGTEVEVSLTASFTFSPSTLTISPGTTVVWRNAAAVFHTVTPDGHSEWQRAALNQANQTFSHTFNTAGTFAYYCEPHQGQGMTGTITVQ